MKAVICSFLLSKSSTGYMLVAARFFVVVESFAIGSSIQVQTELIM
jgi:hypothetical protein